MTIKDFQTIINSRTRKQAGQNVPPEGVIDEGEIPFLIFWSKQDEKQMDKDQATSGNIIDFKVLKRLLKFVMPYKGRFYLVIVVMGTLGVPTSSPILIQYNNDNDVARGDYQAC